jgi:hypothetical protein
MRYLADSYYSLAFWLVHLYSESHQQRTKEKTMNTEWKEVAKEDFFRAIGPQDVHPHLIGKWPYVSLFQTRDRMPKGKIDSDGRFWLPA